MLKLKNSALKIFVKHVKLMKVCNFHLYSTKMFFIKKFEVFQFQLGAIPERRQG